MAQKAPMIQLFESDAKIDVVITGHGLTMSATLDMGDELDPLSRKMRHVFLSTVVTTVINEFLANVPSV